MDGWRDGRRDGRMDDVPVVYRKREKVLDIQSKEISKANIQVIQYIYNITNNMEQKLFTSQVITDQL
jgi:hypothetical protein